MFNPVCIFYQFFSLFFLQLIFITLFIKLFLGFRSYCHVIIFNIPFIRQSVSFIVVIQLHKVVTSFTFWIYRVREY